MELLAKREPYVQNLKKFLSSIHFTDKFWNELKKHQKNIYIDSVNDFKDNEMAQKVFIFLEFTRERTTCEKMVQILRDSGLTAAAKELESFNKSPGLMKVTNETEITVFKSRQETRGTENYLMNKIIRGKCIIINNEPKIFKESFRFESVFRQLNFDVELKFQMTTQQIKHRLTLLNADKILLESDALIVMIISHGTDERVIGYDANNVYNAADVMKISEIVNIFSNEDCTSLGNKPKLFFFTCCRIKQAKTVIDIPLSQPSQPIGMHVWPPTTSNEVQIWPKNLEDIIRLNSDSRIVLELETVDQSWITKNRDTFICYACAEGETSFFDTLNGLSYFGQALSHSIAQFACEKNLQTIMSRTCDFMAKYVDEKDRSSPEIRALDLRRQLFFNPGIPANQIQ